MPVEQISRLSLARFLEKNITLKPYRDGFVIEFANERENIVFLPHGKKDYFLSRGSTNPLKGEPYLWAVAKGQILKIHVLSFDKNGRYTIKTFCYDCHSDSSLNNLFSYSLEEETPKENNTISLEAFYGTYVGVAKEIPTIAGTEVAQRDIELMVKPFRKKRGFDMRWVTVIYKNSRTDLSVKRREAHAQFIPSYIPSLYEPFHKKNPFKITKKLDLLLGDQLKWARLSGKHLTIYTLQVNDEGEYILKSYHRELTPTGSIVEFKSFTDGSQSKEVTGILTKVKPDID